MGAPLRAFHLPRLAAELMTTQGLGHRRILRDSGAVAQVTAFLAERLPERPGLTRERAAVSALC